MTSTDKAPERIWAWTWPQYINLGQWSGRESASTTEYVRADLYEAAQAEIERLTVERDEARAERSKMKTAWSKAVDQCDAEFDRAEKAESERDEAKAQLGAVIEQAAQAAYQWWDDDDAQELRQHIRDIDPDAQKALDKMLAKAREDAIREAADIVNKNRDISGWVSHDEILTLINEGGRDE